MKGVPQKWHEASGGLFMQGQLDRASHDTTTVLGSPFILGQVQRIESRQAFGLVGNLICRGLVWWVWGRLEGH